MSSSVLSGFLGLGVLEQAIFAVPDPIKQFDHEEISLPDAPRLYLLM